MSVTTQYSGEILYTRTSAGNTTSDDTLWYLSSEGFYAGEKRKITKVKVTFTHIRNFASAALTDCTFEVFAVVSANTDIQLSLGYISGSVVGSGTTAGSTISGELKNINEDLQVYLAENTISRIYLGIAVDKYQTAHDLRCTSASQCIAEFEHDLNMSSPMNPVSCSIDAGYTIVTGDTVKMSWTGATPGVNNPITGYRIDYHDKLIATPEFPIDPSGSIRYMTSATNVYGADVAAPALGYQRQYRVYTLGTEDGFEVSDTYTSSINAATRVGIVTSPTSVTISPTYALPNSQVTLSWSGASATHPSTNSITGYWIYQNGTHVSLYDVDGSTTSVTVRSNSSAGGRVDYTVQAKGSAVDGPISSSVATVYSYGAPSAPTYVAAANSDNSKPTSYALETDKIIVSWSGAKAGANNNAITGYQIFISGNPSVIATAGRTDSSKELSIPLRAGSSYSFTVKTVGQQGTLSGDSVASNEIYVYSNVSAPTSVTLNDQTESVYLKSGATATLAWLGASGGSYNEISKYRVFIDDEPRSPDISDLSTKVPIGNPGESHEFSVRSIGQRGDVSGSSPSVTSYTYSDPTAPTSFVVLPEAPEPGSEVTLAWFGQSDGSQYNRIEEFIVYRDTDPNGSFSAIAGRYVDAECTVIAPPEANITYYYKVAAVGERRDSVSEKSSVYATVTTADHTECTPPSYVYISPEYAKASSNDVSLQWQYASGGTNNSITGYRISRDGLEYKTIQSIDTRGSLSVVSSAIAGRSYSYTVTTLGSVSGLDSIPSDPVLVYTYSDPTAPTDVRFDESIAAPGTNVTLRWSGAVPGEFNTITGYQIYKGASLQNATLVDSRDSATSSIQVAAPAAGVIDQYFVVTVGSLSSSVASRLASISSLAYTKLGNPSSIRLSSTLSDGNPVDLYWTPSTGGSSENPLNHYDIYRRSSSDKINWSEWQFLDSVDGNATLLSVSPSTVYGNYYSYGVQAIGAVSADHPEYDSDLVPSEDVLRRNHEPLPAYQDTIVARETYVKAAHITDLQDRLIFLLEFNHIITDPGFARITQYQTNLKDWSVHIQQLRAAVDLINPNHEPWIEIPVNCPRADVMNQLRRIVASI